MQPSLCPFEGCQNEIAGLAPLVRVRDQAVLGKLYLCAAHFSLLQAMFG